MILHLLLLGLSLVFILFFCMIFTNAVEWLGKALNLGNGITGSILAAIGTALPETIIPIIAILLLRDLRSMEVGIGAIAGAPFMLSTLGFFITGSAVIMYSVLKKRKSQINADIKVISRDLTFFIITYGIAVLATFFKEYASLKNSAAVLLVFIYILYVKLTFSKDCGENCSGDMDELYLSRALKVKTNMPFILLELIIALTGIIYGSNLFVGRVEDVSAYFGIEPLILSILITPIATELPEKLNSVIWIRKRRDTLALGNISGAMVFQSCVPVAIGIAFTSWDLSVITLLSAVLALLSALLNLLWIRNKKRVNPYLLMSGLLFYIVFLFYIFLIN